MRPLPEHWQTLCGASARRRLPCWTRAAVKVVIARIDAIGEVTLDSKDAIEAARAAYDKLTDEQKKLVPNYETLTKAEETYAALADAACTPHKRQGLPRSLP